MGWFIALVTTLITSCAASYETTNNGGLDTYFDVDIPDSVQGMEWYNDCFGDCTDVIHFQVPLSDIEGFAENAGLKEQASPEAFTWHLGFPMPKWFLVGDIEKPRVFEKEREHPKVQKRLEWHIQVWINPETGEGFAVKMFF